MKNMNEKTLNERLKKTVIISFIIGLIILLFGVSIIRVIQNSLDDIVREEMETETKEYRRRIIRQMDKDIQLLETLATVFSHVDVTNKEWFDQCLCDANRKNGFVTMSFFGKDGMGTLVYNDDIIREDVDYHTLNEGVHGVVNKALNGTVGISDLFQSVHREDMMFAYGVPVYGENGEILGALLAGSNIETFQDVLTAEDKDGKIDAVHLVNGNGRMLLSTVDMPKELIPTNIFTRDFFDESDLERIVTGVKGGERVFVHMHDIKGRYSVFLNPVGFNDWYLMYVSNQQGVNQTAYSLANTVGVTFVLLLGIIIFLLIYICKMMAGNNKSLVRLAYKDMLTGVDNIVRFNQKLKTRRDEDKGFCLVALNVHQFKFINEIFGVKVADDLLCNMAKAIKLTLVEGEFFCRESGDLFYIYMNETNKRLIEHRINGLIAKIVEDRLSDKTDYQIHIYAGALVCDSLKDRATSNEMLITRTRFAMQFSKKLPSNQLHFYDAEIHKSEEMENYVETHMHRALQNGEFKLFLQPKINLSTDKLIGAEALVRWITEDGSMVFPDVFIPQFERNGFCIQLDMYMVEQACKQIRSWIDKGIKPIPISVNQSRLLFFDSDYIVNLGNVLEKYNIPAKLITLEILEGLALERPKEINEKLKQLRAMGFSISMDDFGSGYSSFNTLGNLEIDELKLDRSFLLEASSTHGNRFSTIMEHIIKLTKSLNIITVAEGVETPENEEMIKRLGCDIGQGYLYSKPISAVDFNSKYMVK